MAWHIGVGTSSSNLKMVAGWWSQLICNFKWDPLIPIIIIEDGVNAGGTAMGVHREELLKAVREARPVVEMIFPHNSTIQVDYYLKLAMALLQCPDSDLIRCSTKSLDGLEPPSDMGVELAKEALSLYHKALALVGRRGAAAQARVRVGGRTHLVSLYKHGQEFSSRSTSGPI